jgi:hypothetical protein
MSWLWGKPAPSAEDEARRVAAENAATLEKLQQQHDVNAAMIGKYAENVQRLNQQQLDAASPAKAQEYKMACQRAFQTMRTLERQQATLAGQIDTLLGVTNNVQAMNTNVELHGRIKDSNAVTARIAGHLDVDDVHETMDQVGEHQQQHDEVSDALAGRHLGSSMTDPEEMAADMAEFLGQGRAQTAAAPAVAQAPSREAADRARVEEEEAALERLLSTMPKLPTTGRTAAAAQARGK